MNDAPSVLVLLLVVGAVGGALGGLAVFAAGVRWLRASHIAITRQKLEIEAQTVRVPLVVEQPEPITVPLLVAPAPTAAALGARILAEAPDLGPRALSRILEIAPSSAQLIVDRVKAGECSTPNGDGRPGPNTPPEVAKS